MTNGRGVGPVLILLIGAAMWGLTWWPLKFFAGQGIEGAPLILVGYGSLGLLLLPVLWRDRDAWRGEWRLVLLMVLLGGYANLAFATSLIHGEVVRVMILFYLAPVWGVLGGRFFLGERIDRQRALGVVLAVLGAFILLGGWRMLDAPPGWLDLLAVSAGLAFALNNVTCRAARATPMNSKVAAMMLGCGLMAWLLLTGRGEAVPSLALTVWVWLLAFGLGWLFLATFTTQYGVTHMEAGRASVLLITELVVAVVSATLIGGGMPGGREVAGGMLVFVAAILEAWRPSAPAAAEPAAVVGDQNSFR